MKGGAVVNKSTKNDLQAYEKRRRWLSGISLAVVTALTLLATWFVCSWLSSFSQEGFRDYIRSFGAWGWVVLLGLQTMLIVGGNTKLLPLTGVTLPLISYGGSSLVSMGFSMGLLLGISSMNAEDEARDIEQYALSREVLE